MDKWILRLITAGIILLGLFGLYASQCWAVDWLGTYQHRLQGTIDNTYIDSDLTGKVCTVVADGDDEPNIAAIFTEVGDSFLKIAVTASDGTTQIYGEVQRWDNATKEIVLNISKSDWVLDADAGTPICIYYDSEQDDNTTYIGEPNSAAAFNVWDVNCIGSWHLDETTGAALDSTIYNHDGVYTGDVPDTARGGKVYLGQDFDGTGDYVLFTADSVYPATAAEADKTSLTCWLYYDDVTNLRGVAEFVRSNHATTGYLYLGFYGGVLYGGCRDDSTTYVRKTGNLSTGTWYHVAITQSGIGSTIIMYINGAVNSNAGDVQFHHEYYNSAIGFNEYQSDIYYGDGIIDETRLYDRVLSADEIKWYYNNINTNQIDWETEETYSSGAPSAVKHGQVIPIYED
jgi:hypothetical protein